MHIAIIGAGPGGYSSAFYAAENGCKVSLIEKSDDVGGVCLNRGCIPSKTLIHLARLISETREVKEKGIFFSEPSIKLDEIQKWKKNVILKLAAGLNYTIKKLNINVNRGDARFLSSNTIQLHETSGTIRQINFDKAIIASGTEPIQLYSSQFGRIIDSTKALEFESIPKTMLVIGGGYIGLEIGLIYSAFGSKVTIVEVLPQLLSGCDRDLFRILEKNLKKKFTNIYLNTKVKELTEKENEIKVILEQNDGTIIDKNFETILISAGRRPVIEELSLQLTNVKTNNKGFITVDSSFRTADENIYAVGDITGPPLLAHKAYAQAKIVVNSIIGLKKEKADKLLIPSVVFTDPEIAWCGIMEEDAKFNNIDISVNKFHWTASGKAASMGRTDGLTKLILEKRTGKILGAGIAGCNASELISECTAAISKGMTKEEFSDLIHPHPTLSETIYDALKS